VVVVPARAAYLIEDNDREAAVRAVQEASTRWAGFSEPIIPVSSSGSVTDWDRRVVEVSAVDGLVNINLERDIANQVASSMGLPWVGLGQINGGGMTRFSTHPAGLRQEGRLAEQAAVLSSADGSLWEKIAAGDLTAKAEGDCAKASVMVRRSTGGYELVLAQLYETCWLDAGASQFHENTAKGMFGPTPVIIWVTRPDSVEDCLYYWNLRAIRSLRRARAPMMLLPLDWNTDWDTLRRVLASSLARPEELIPDVLLLSGSVENDDLERIGRLLGLVKTESPPSSRVVIPPPPPRSGPFTFGTNIDPRLLLDVPRRYGETVDALVQVYRDSTIVEVDSPVGFSGHGRLLVRLLSSAFDGIPRRPASARLFHEDSSWFTDDFEGDALQLATNASSRYNINLRIPTLTKATWSLLEEQTDAAQLSDKGRLAKSLDQVGDSDILLDSSVIEVINYLKTPSSKNVMRALQKARAKGSADEYLENLAAEWRGRVQRRFRPKRQIRGDIDPDAGSAVETLSSRSWAERGLRIMCDQCMIDSFIPIQNATSAPLCPACGATDQTYEPKGDPELHYRLNSLVDRVADQGVIPHLFAVASLRVSSAQTHMLPGVECTLSDGTSSEVDLYGVHEGRVVAGEAKTKAKDFTEEQITRDIKLTTQLSADVHLMVCTEPIAQTTRALAQEHADKAGIELKVIDRQAPNQDAT